MDETLSIIIPVFNEKYTIKKVVDNLLNHELINFMEIIIVDDGSTDGTRKILEDYQFNQKITIINKDKNSGKGDSIRVGIEKAKNDIIIIQDADLEYDPSDYKTLLNPIFQEKADVVYGSRFLHGERRVLYFWHSIGNKILTLASNFFSDLNLTDMETCYKVFKRPIIQNIILRSKRFGFEPEITAKISRLHLSIYEVPINYYGRSYEEGKKITWKDGFSAIWCIIYYAFFDKKCYKNKKEIEECSVFKKKLEKNGIATLRAFESAKNYNSWIIERVKKHIGSNVLEIGSGIGNIIHELLKLDNVSKLTASDPDEKALEMLASRFEPDSRIKYLKYDAQDAPYPLFGSDHYDTIICSNVLEHINDDKKALENMAKLIPNGNLVLLVPANPSLYSGLDEDLDHFRRYRKNNLSELLNESGYEVEEIYYHNYVGALGWWWAGKIRKRRRVRVKDTRRFDKLVPLLKYCDPFISPIFGGVSIIAIAKRKNT